MTNLIPALDLAFEKAHCFPFYVYDEDGSNRRENITDWALEQFRTHYGAAVNTGRSRSRLVGEGREITKWDIFYYVYGLVRVSVETVRIVSGLPEKFA